VRGRSYTRNALFFYADANPPAGGVMRLSAFGGNDAKIENMLLTDGRPLKAIRGSLKEK